MIDSHLLKISIGEVNIVHLTFTMVSMVIMVGGVWLGIMGSVMCMV